MNKKAQNITIGTIILMVLALIVLVVLVVGFTGGWTNLWGRISGFFGGANVDSVVQACNVACATQAKYDFCDRERTVSADTDEFRVEKDTDDKPTDKIVAKTDDGADAKKGKASCKNLADWYSGLGFQTCSGLC